MDSLHAKRTKGIGKLSNNSWVLHIVLVISMVRRLEMRMRIWTIPLPCIHEVTSYCMNNPVVLLPDWFGSDPTSDTKCRKFTPDYATVDSYILHYRILQRCHIQTQSN